MVAKNCYVLEFCWTIVIEGNRWTEVAEAGPDRDKHVSWLRFCSSTSVFETFSARASSND
jgi:hypothetical protein